MVVVSAYNLRTPEVEADRLRIQGQSQLQSKCEALLGCTKPSLKTKNIDSNIERCSKYTL